MHQATLLLQNKHFEEIAHAFGVADDGMPDRRLAEAAARLAGSGEDRQLAERLGAVGGVGHTERPGIGERRQKPRLLVAFAEGRVIRLDAGLLQQFGDRCFVPVGILPEVGGGEMEAEHLDRPDERPEPDRHEGSAVAAAERMLDRAQVREQLLRCAIGLALRGPDPRLLAGERPERLRDPRVDADDGAAIGLVLAVRIGVARPVGQRLERCGRADEDARHRKLALQSQQFAEIEAQHRFGMTADRELQRLGRDIGIAVPVAADPVAHAKEGRGRPAEMLVDLLVELRQLGQEGRFVIPERVLDLIADRQLRVAQQPRLPELRDAGAQHQGILREVARRAQGIALRQQPGDGALRIERALALHLGRCAVRTGET